MRLSSPFARRALLIVLAASIVVMLIEAAGSSAATLEIGRCTKVVGAKEGKKTVYHGAYTNSKCTKVSAVHTGKYEWQAGPGPEDHYAGTTGALFAIEGSRSPAPETKCGGGSAEGEITSATTLSQHVAFGGCEWAEYACVEAGECPQPCPEEPEGGANPQECEVFYPCHSEGAAAGEVRGALPVDGELFTLSEGRKPKVGVRLSGGGAGYECDGMGVGSLGALNSAEVLPVDRMTRELRLAYGSRGGSRPLLQLKVNDVFEEAIEVRATE